jgi:carboxyl-terminal processing protease
MMNFTLKPWQKVSTTLVLVIGLFSFSDPGTRFFEIAKNLDIYATLFKELNTYYVDEVNPNTLLKQSVVATLKQFDPYTVFYAEDDIEDYRSLTTNQYNGIGAVIGTIKGKINVMQVHEGSPAAKAGLRVGDQIVKLDGINVAGKKEPELDALIKGQNGSVLKTSVLRYGSTKPTELSITRDVVKIDNVPYSGMVSKEVGYIYLTEFSATAAREVKQSYANLKSEGMKYLVLDLRGNPGGLLSMAVEICNMFIAKDSEVVSTKGKVSSWNKIYKATAAPTDLEMPIVVLTNTQSASASEIVSGVLQDYDRAVIIGQKSYGKGLVQVTRDLSYNCKLKVTTAKYYTPSGRCIQAIDYSHRNADGSAGKLPDSLMTAFKTRNKRVVYDGGGIAPDIEIGGGEKPTVLLTLQQELLLYDYANKYVSEHPEIKATKDFNFTDADYTLFSNWLKVQNFDFGSQLEKDIKSLEATAKKEKYLESIKDQLSALKAKVSNQRKQDLVTYKSEIKLALEEEIAKHLFTEKERKLASFTKDKEVKAAIELFANMPKYNSILAGKK